MYPQERDLIQIAVSFLTGHKILILKVPCQESVYSRNVFFTLILPKKVYFWASKLKKDLEKKVEHFGALKEMAVAG